MRALCRAFYRAVIFLILSACVSVRRASVREYLTGSVVRRSSISSGFTCPLRFLHSAPRGAGSRGQRSYCCL
ncbi:hypothetical protein NDU88_006751 [Pleurodeles waltl]|uniref:Secreted protein n=1 Tax=Pleurodeles waltl TaxID=8319 RepID=A0AAV7NR27_PLEWA|nr:hypothetical protein NDU88_006751 [Pleurodeles waltl]